MIAALVLLAQVATAPDAPVDVVEHLGERVADASFMDSESNRVQLRDLTARGKPVVLTLIYFDCPMLCSLVQKGVIKKNTARRYKSRLTKRVNGLPA